MNSTGRGSSVSPGYISFIVRIVEQSFHRRQPARVPWTNGWRYVRITANFCSLHATTEHGNGALGKLPRCLRDKSNERAVVRGTWYPVDRSRCCDSFLSWSYAGRDSPTRPAFKISFAILKYVLSRLLGRFHTGGSRRVSRIA